jgi:hypothetical protein
MKKFLPLLITAIVLIAGYYVLIYQPGHDTVSQPDSVTMAPTMTSATVQPSGAQDETADILQAVKTEVIAKRGQGASELKFTVSKILGNFAQGGASGQGGGGMWFAAKVNGSWKLVWDGNGIILCSDIDPYPDFPVSMVPQCYNDKTDTMVTR